MVSIITRNLRILISALSILVVITLIDRNDSAACTTYQTETECDSNHFCEWIGTSGIDEYCACASPIALEVLFLMDSSGAIGSTTWELEKAFVSEMITYGINDVSSVAVMTFGSGAWSQWDFTDQQQPRSVITDVVQNLPFASGSSYMKTAIKDGVTIFDETGSPDVANVMVLITDGRAWPRSQSVCNNNNIKTRLDDSDVQVIVIGVGSGFSTGSISCLVDDPTTQIIEVNDFGVESFAIFQQYTDSVLCPATISLTLTEVRIDDTNGNRSLSNAHFVEFYNDGVTVDLSVNSLILDGIVSGIITILPSGLTSITAATYIVFYDRTRDTPQCYECVDNTDCSDTDNDMLCDDAIYIPCNGADDECTIDTTSFSNDYWFQTMQDGSDNSYIVNVTTDLDFEDWPVVAPGHTFELRDVLLSQKDGEHWDMSCTQFGTPGSFPIPDTECTTPAPCPNLSDQISHCDEDSNCDDCQEWGGCTQCADGYWIYQYEFRCQECSNIDNCVSCDLWSGCGECEAGYHIVHTQLCDTVEGGQKGVATCEKNGYY